MTVHVEEESAISGSGPAHVSYYVDAPMAAATTMGFSAARDHAEELAANVKVIVELKSIEALQEVHF